MLPLGLTVSSQIAGVRSDHGHVFIVVVASFELSREPFHEVLQEVVDVDLREDIPRIHGGP